jgi:hypothetical protein
MCFGGVLLLLFHLDMTALKMPMYSVEWRSCNEGVIMTHLSTRENRQAEPGAAMKISQTPQFALHKIFLPILHNLFLLERRFLS